MSAKLRPARVPHPGHIIRRELEARGWTQKDLADIMGRPEQAISEIVNGRKRIIPETALQLAEAFGTSADLWLNLESNYRLHQARTPQQDRSITRRSQLYNLVPLTEIRKRGWIDGGDSLDDLEHSVCAFLGIAAPTELPQVAVRLRQSAGREPEVAAEIAWVKRVEQLAYRQTIAEFDRDLLNANLPKLLSLTAEAAAVARVPELLEQLGVHFIIVPHLAQTYLDGAAFTRNGRPLVALTLRYSRIDSFWFTLLHELAHILTMDEGGYLDHMDEPPEDKAEQEANRLSREWLIDQAAYDEFVSGAGLYFSEKRIRTYAECERRHPGIVLGRLQHDGLVPYKNLRKLLVDVKSFLAPWIDASGPAL